MSNGFHIFMCVSLSLPRKKKMKKQWSFFFFHSGTTVHICIFSSYDSVFCDSLKAD